MLLILCLCQPENQTMFKNFFLTAHRNIVRNKIQSAIQVTSLTIGITAAILIGLYAKYEFSYDHV
jgi:putative ABC transport system permease protein